MSLPVRMACSDGLLGWPARITIIGTEKPPDCGVTPGCQSSALVCQTPAPVSRVFDRFR